ncbi:hypothetical protein [Rathayibacter sp. AY1F9]|uniref:hypothetical protein n=1 Tax=Rathayibacter sp. AY1F9 TaxID=2080563 RepID=UPI0011AFFC73|nr:hypothetical protein [Rathayibacter sp. AY1F9]
MSDLTVWYGDVSTTQTSAAVVVENTSTRTYNRGQFKIDFSGAIAGECAGTSQGIALDAGAPGSRVAAPDPVDAASVDGWNVSATEEPTSGGVTVSAELDGATYSAVFTDAQASRGEAEILITDHSTGESHNVVYNSSEEVAFAVSETDAISR